MKTHKNLDVWLRSIDFVTSVYSLTKDFPREELYGLKSQIRRAAVSIPSNIAEGAARQSKKEFLQFLYIALGSSVEVDTQVRISFNLGYIDHSSFELIEKELNDIGKMINGLISYLKKQAVK